MLNMLVYNFGKSKKMLYQAMFEVKSAKRLQRNMKRNLELKGPTISDRLLKQVRK